MSGATMPRGAEGSSAAEVDQLIDAIPPGVTLKRLLRSVDLARLTLANGTSEEGDQNVQKDAPPPPPPVPRADLPRDLVIAARPYQPVDVARFRELLLASPRVGATTPTMEEMRDAQPTAVHVVNASDEWDGGPFVTDAVL